MNGYEIEKKYIVQMPTQDILSKADKVYKITQTYLESHRGISERVRCRKEGERTQYFHTVKVRISPIKCIEEEKEISFEEYVCLLERKDKSLEQIEKTRYVFEHDDMAFEVDVYTFWDKIASLEVELENEQQPFSVPDCFKVIKDVTEDARLKNHALARNIVDQSEFV